MPLQTLYHNTAKQTRIEKRIQSLVKSGVLYVDDEQSKEYHAGFCMSIQYVSKKQSNILSFGKPEGIRVLVASGKKTIASIDFLFAGKQLRFSHIRQGARFELLIKTLNRLEKIYARKKDNYHVELISFLFSPELFVLVKSKKQKQYYYGLEKKLVAITQAELKTRLEKIAEPRMFSFENH